MPAGEWRVLIADDEPAARRGVRQLLAAHPRFHVVGECRNGSEVLRALDLLRPDLLFLDIQMPGMDGFEVIRRRTAERMPAIVFLTAYDDFALDAFDVQALDYLVKPVTEARFATALRRVGRHLRGGALPEREPGIVVSTPRGANVLSLGDIDWIESADNYARLWAGARSHLLRESLGSLEQRLAAHGFVRAHRRALVRLGALRQLTRDAGGRPVVVLASGARIPVARRKRAAMVKALSAIARDD